MSTIKNGVTIGDKHSFKDWGLYFKSRPEISPPEPKTNFIKIPGSDGQLDLSLVLSDEMLYENRDITCTFSCLQAREKWPSVFSEVMDYCHGREFKIIFDDDCSYYYEGIVTVNKWESNKYIGTLVVNANVKPYKKDVQSSSEDWLWDTFSFESGVIREWGSMEVSGSKTITFKSSRQTVTPTFKISGSGDSGMKIAFTGKKGTVTKTFQDGTYTDDDFKIMEYDSNKYVLTGTGTVTIDYRGGRF
jgi:hypothetical protein